MERQVSQRRSIGSGRELHPSLGSRQYDRQCLPMNRDHRSLHPQGGEVLRRLPILEQRWGMSFAQLHGKRASRGYEHSEIHLWRSMKRKGQSHYRLRRHIGCGPKHQHDQQPHHDKVKFNRDIPETRLDVPKYWQDSSRQQRHLQWM
jgi:hypothetical protein